MENIDKTDYGLYVCQAANEHTTTNITTLVVVESKEDIAFLEVDCCMFVLDTTPQAPQNIQYKQSSSNLLLSWEPGYDGGRPQHFIIWYRLFYARKRSWNQIRVMPNNASEFTLFDLKAQQIYEFTIVAENDFGLGTFAPIIFIELNHTEEMPLDNLYHSNRTNLTRPFSPTNLRLSQSGSHLYITWNHPKMIESSVNILYYVIQWRSTILFNNQQSQYSIILNYPTRSYVLKDLKQSKYIIQVIAYSDRGTYSPPVESQINIRMSNRESSSWLYSTFFSHLEFTSILAYSGSGRWLIILLFILIVLTLISICLCMFCMVKYYSHRRSYCTDVECGKEFSLDIS